MKKVYVKITSNDFNCLKYKTTCMLLVFFLGLNISFGQEELKFTNSIIEGNQFDVVSFKNKIYIIDAYYYELDTIGNIVFEDNEINDLRQKPVDYEPAIGVSKNGTI